ncbi:PEP-CTERM/exosortase A-associated glycosyltransferase, Daro_2409 family [Nitrosomonas marina]|uniref:PEP-CTERM/exosortase A-associated glycosyltransferase, Daro_2409 family n=1 Tax=Nitrosomonas marina TaxID=917 RepID=A0A1H9ZGA8_9PROT|nr:TIGR04063 family PEP-CTERM/XrtA system glycosyltransferase [Nitrosomonas marina]SES80626.1 PEP-CTERM/exosortase A-associated glycosyltransferase, Daro_2409 family [Nitrosomonas marina]
MDKDIKVLHVLDHSLPLHSGYTFRTRAILSIQHQMGIQTALVTGSKHSENSQCIDAIETVDGLSFYRTYPSFLNRLPLFNQLDVVLTLIKRIELVLSIEQPDIIHAHSPCLNGLAALHIGKKYNIPVLYEMRASWEDAAVSHGTCQENDLRYKISRALETYVLKRANHITTICQGLKEDIQLRGVSPEKITVIPNAVNTEKFYPIQEKDSLLCRQLNLDNKKVLGFIGSFYEYEGLELLIQAVAALKDECPDFHVLLVGGGQAESALKAMVSRFDISDRVTFTGRVNHNEVMKYYSIIDLLIYPRLPMRLTELVTPLKPLEAMAMGKPCIASDVGGHQELIIDHEDGLLFKAGDLDNLVTLLRTAYFQSDFATLINNGIEKVRHQRNWAVCVAPYKAIYQSLAEQN